MAALLSSLGWNLKQSSSCQTVPGNVFTCTLDSLHSTHNKPNKTLLPMLNTSTTPIGEARATKQEQTLARSGLSPFSTAFTSLLFPSSVFLQADPNRNAHYNVLGGKAIRQAAATARVRS